MTTPTTAPVPRKRKASLRDIAKELNVSISLVSKVVSGRFGTTSVRKETQEMILAKAKELNYAPNLLATALQKGHTGSIGLIMHPVGVPGSELTSDLLKGITSAMNRHGLSLWLSFFEDDDEFSKLCNQRASRNIDGLIVAGIHHPKTEDLIKTLQKDGLPIVTIYENYQIDQIPNITVNHQQQSQLATKHLIDQGCKNIGFIKLDNSRYAGYCAALKEANIPLNEKLVYVVKPDDFSTEAGKEAVRHWLEQGQPIDGLAAQSDPQAVGAIQEFNRHNINIPEQVLIVGIDNSPTCEICQTPISSITAEMESVGDRALNTLRKLIDKKEANSTSIEPNLVIRDSSNRNT